MERLECFHGTFMDRSGTPPYSHPVYMPVLVIVRILYSGVNKSSVSHFSCKKKPPFFRQSVSMAIWWPVSERIKAPAKVSQHFNATYRNIAGCNMLREFGHPVVTCCDMLGVVGSNLKMIKFFMQHLWMLHDVVVVWLVPATVLPAHQVDFQPATCRNTLQHGGQTRATCCAHQYCDLWLSNVAIVWPELANAGPTNVGMCCVEMLYRLAGA